MREQCLRRTTRLLHDTRYPAARPKSRLFGRAIGGFGSSAQVALVKRFLDFPIQIDSSTLLYRYCTILRSGLSPMSVYLKHLLA